MRSLSTEAAIAMTTLLVTTTLAPVGWLVNHWYTRRGKYDNPLLVYCCLTSSGQPENYPEDLVERGVYRVLTQLSVALGGGQVPGQEEESDRLETTEGIELDEQSVAAPGE